LPRSDQHAGGEQGDLHLGFGEPEPNTCKECGTDFPRTEVDCPECPDEKPTIYGHQPHPYDEWTSTLVRQLVRAGAGYVAIRVDLPADHQAFMWWADRFEGRSRGPGGTWDSFSLGLDDVVEDAHLLKLVHCTDCPPSIARQMRGSRGADR